MARPGRARRAGPAAWIAAVIVGALWAWACGSGDGSDDGEGGGSGAGGGTLRLTSTAFVDGGPIPERHSCEGENLPPPLAWSGVPEGTAELALIVEDRGAPSGTFFHWVVLGLDPALGGLAEGQLPAGARLGEASSGLATYIGMCPPGDDPAHRYVFTLYALRAPIGLPQGTPGATARAEAGRLALGRGELVGTYGR